MLTNWHIRQAVHRAIGREGADLRWQKTGHRIGIIIHIVNVPNPYAPEENKNNTHEKLSFISTAYESSVLGITK